MYPGKNDVYFYWNDDSHDCGCLMKNHGARKMNKNISKILSEKKYNAEFNIQLTFRNKNQINILR